MYTRTVDYAIKPEKKEEFSKAVYTELLPIVQKQPGFADLLCLMSDERPFHSLLITFWKSQSDADNFYHYNAPMVEIFQPYVVSQKVEHFFVDASTMFKIASGKAA